MGSQPIRLTCAAALALMVVLAGCGGDSGSDASSTPTDSAPPSTTSTDPAPTTTGTDVPATGADVLARLTGAASDAVPVLFSRSGATYDDDVAAALALVTDDFAAEFEASNRGVRREFVRSGIVSTTEVSGAGVSRVTDTGGEVLVFFTQTTTREDGRDVPATFSATVTLVDTDGTLLVDDVQTLPKVTLPGQEDEHEDDAEPVADPVPGFTDALVAARDFATLFTNLDYRTVAEDQDAVRALASADFADRLGTISADLEDQVTEAQAVLTSAVEAVGLAEGTDTSATVLLLTRGSVVAAGAEGGQERSFRLRLDLVRSDAGWLVDDLAFVD